MPFAAPRALVALDACAGNERRLAAATTAALQLGSRPGSTLDRDRNRCRC